MTLSSLRAKIIEANPSILELGFGCEVIGDDETVVQKVVAVGVDGQIWTDYEGSREYYKGSLREIIGRPIRLLDILVAMRGNSKAPIGIDMNGHFIDCDDDMNNLKISEVRWDFKDDDLSHQSTETISFLCDLLLK